MSRFSLRYSIYHHHAILRCNFAEPDQLISEIKFLIQLGVSSFSVRECPSDGTFVVYPVPGFEWCTSYDEYLGNV